jgi:hypothetical protein
MLISVGRPQQTACFFGHPFTETNTRRSAAGAQVCVVCARRRLREWRTRRHQLERNDKLSAQPTSSGAGELSASARPADPAPSADPKRHREPIRLPVTADHWRQLTRAEQLQACYPPHARMRAPRANAQRADHTDHDPSPEYWGTPVALNPPLVGRALE